MRRIWIFEKGYWQTRVAEDSIDVIRRLSVVPQNLDAVTNEPALGNDVGGVDKL
jgi:hypothetical protein